MNIEERDVKKNTAFKDELLQEGGLSKVPCLRIEDDAKNVTWMYESNDITAYLKAEFSTT